MVSENAFKKQEQDQSKLTDLGVKYTLAALYLLASDLRLDTESLLRIIGRVQGIAPALAKRIHNLWIQKFGTSYYPAPKSCLETPEPVLVPEIEIETIEKGSAFYYKDKLYGTNDPYIDVVFWDILPNFLNEEQYDKAPLTRVRNKIIPIIDDFYQNLYVRPSENISVSPLFGPERRKNRTFELHLINRETKEVQYALSYSNGELQVSDGNIPAERIIPFIRAEGFWE
jgi:hypothetical protein